MQQCLHVLHQYRYLADTRVELLHTIILYLHETSLLVHDTRRVPVTTCYHMAHSLGNQPSHVTFGFSHVSAHAPLRVGRMLEDLEGRSTRVKH